MSKSKLLSALLLGIKNGIVAVLATFAFLPVPIIIGEYFGRLNMVGHYSGPLPLSWILGFSIATVIIFSLPLFLSGFILSIGIGFAPGATFLKNGRGRLFGTVLGIPAAYSGILMFESYGLLEAFGDQVFIGIMIIWGMLLFGWIGHKLQQRHQFTLRSESVL